MKDFIIASDVNGAHTYSIPFSDTVNVQVLAAGIAESVTIPSGAKFISFSSTADFFARSGGVATVPSVDITDGSGSELNPIIRSLVGVSTLSIVASADCIVTMSFYS